MGINVAQDWPVYILLAAVFCFFIYVVISGMREEKKSKEKK